MSDTPLMQRLTPRQRRIYDECLADSYGPSEGAMFDKVTQTHMVYLAAVLRGVVDHPPPWLAETNAIGYVVSVAPVGPRPIETGHATTFTAEQVLTFQGGR